MSTIDRNRGERGSNGVGYSMPKTSGRILLAEDNPLTLKHLARLLENQGYEAYLASDGRAAVELLDEHSFDAVVTDIRMSDIDGIQLLRTLRDRGIGVPVVLFTGYPSIATAVPAIEFGAFHYLVKPLDVEKFLEVVGDAVNVSQQTERRRQAIKVLEAQTSADNLVELENNFDRMIRALWMAYHPLVRISDRTVFGYEALLRSAEPSLPHPGAVLDAAERLERLSELGRVVRNSVASTMRVEPDRGLTFVNLHPHDLIDDALFSRDAPLAEIADRVVLEITERASLSAVPDLTHRIAELRQIGYRIALDDLGAGYASLNSFAELEPDFVKIDMTLVRGVTTDRVKQRLIQTVTTLCSELGVQVVGEGVETVEERDALIDLGCDLLQGFRFAKPGRPFPEITW